MRYYRFTFILIAVLQAHVALAQFHLNGAAVQVNDTCWTLTQDELWQAGSIWQMDKVDLNQSFQVIMELKLGCNDGGADGIVFGLQPVSTSVGQQGEGIGFQGVSPAVGIEFDTWQNDNLGDPAFDHIAISKNGILNHNTSNNLAGPVQASATSSNIEDCDFHKLRVNWDAPAHTLEIWFDCKLRLTYTGDIVNEIFGGDPNVFWGFTSATGGARNLHQVCLSYTTFLNGFEDVTICPGGQYQLHLSGGVSYQWSPSEGLSNPNIPNPIAAPTQTTTYQVTVLDACGNPFHDSIQVAVDGDTVFFDLGHDSILCEGGKVLLDATSFGTDTVAYAWSNGATAPSIEVLKTGHYEVTVTIDNYCVADDRVNISFVPYPSLDELGEDQTLCLEQILLLKADASPGLNFLWQDGSTADSFAVTQPGLYSLTASNICGEVSASISIDYEDCRQVYFPNAFTPNGDGINDAFIPFDNGDVGSIPYVRVYDRWGALAYEGLQILPNDFSLGWDGTTHGKKAAAGVYAWVAEVIFRDGKKVLLKGEITLVR